MIITDLNLVNFRGYKNTKISFTPGINLFVGENAAGKTTLLEAIYYLSLTRSFRTSSNSELIKSGEQTSRIDAKITEGERKKQIKVLITKDAKKIICNDKPISKLSELSNIINVVSFQPKDVLMFDDSPRIRRNFLDVSISKVDQNYLHCISKYDKLVKERNELLKSAKMDDITLEVITSEIINVSEYIVKRRKRYIDEINEYLSTIVKHIKGEKEVIKLVYRPFVEPDEQFIENAKKVFENAKENDLKHKSTSVGIHREDYCALLNDKDLSEYGSQGEKRMITLALKLCPYFLVGDKDKKPIVVLDDVMSELDPNHQRLLARFLSKFEQVFITANKLVIKGASIYEVHDHKIARRNN